MGPTLLHYLLFKELNRSYLSAFGFFKICHQLFVKSKECKYHTPSLPVLPGLHYHHRATMDVTWEGTIGN